MCVMNDEDEEKEVEGERRRGEERRKREDMGEVEDACGIGHATRVNALWHGTGNRRATLKDK